MRRHLATGGCLGLVSLVAAAACSSFEADATTGDTDGGADGTSMVGEGGSGPGDGSDGGLADASDGGPAAIACDAAAPAPEHVLTDTTGIDDLAADALHVYWISKLGHHVERVMIGGTQTETVVADAGAPTALGLTTNNVYWLATHLAVASKAKSAAAKELDTGYTPTLLATGLATAVYATSDGVHEIDEPMNPYIRSFQGNAPSALGYGGSTLTFVAPHGPPATPTLFFIAPTTDGLLGAALDVGRLANDGATVWMTAPAAGQVLAEAIVADGGARTPLATGQVGLGSLVEAGDDLFFSTSAGIRRVAKTGGCIAAVSDASSPAIATTKDWVYFVRTGTDLVRVHR